MCISQICPTDNQPVAMAMGKIHELQNEPESDVILCMGALRSIFLRTVLYMDHISNSLHLVSTMYTTACYGNSTWLVALTATLVYYFKYVWCSERLLYNFIYYIIIIIGTMICHQSMKHCLYCNLYYINSDQSLRQYNYTYIYTSKLYT